MSTSVNSIITLEIVAPTTPITPKNTATICIFTPEDPLNSAITTAGFGKYQGGSSLSQCATDWGVDSMAYAAVQSVYAQKQNITTPNVGGYVLVIPFTFVANSTNVMDLYMDAVNNIAIPYFYAFTFLMDVVTNSPSNYTPLATQCEVDKRMFYMGFSVQANAQTAATAMIGASLVHSRVKYYNATTPNQYGVSNEVAQFVSGSASYNLSFDPNTTNSSLSLAYKQCVGLEPDATISDSLVATLKAAGVDSYPDLDGQGGYQYIQTAYMDEATIYEVDKLAFDCQVNGVNVFTTTTTKVPYTQKGNNQLISAYTTTCEDYQDVNGGNGLIAAGEEWSGVVPFGDPATFNSNIQANGYYINNNFSSYTESMKTAGVAPSTQIAILVSGAITSSNLAFYYQ